MWETISFLVMVNRILNFFESKNFDSSNSMFGRGLNLKYYTTIVSCTSDHWKIKSLRPKIGITWDANSIFLFHNHVWSWPKMTFQLDIRTIQTNITCRNLWKTEKMSLFGNLFCIFSFRYRSETVVANSIFIQINKNFRRKNEILLDRSFALMANINWEESEQGIGSEGTWNQWFQSTGKFIIKY